MEVSPKTPSNNQDTNPAEMEKEDFRRDLSTHVTQSHFLPFHLKILKSLYSRKDHEASPNHQNTDEDKNEDDDVPDSVWDAVGLFLQQRPGLIQYKTKALRFRGIHKQAARHLAENLAVDDSVQVNGAGAKRSFASIMTTPSSSVSASRVTGLLSPQSTASHGGPRKRHRSSFALVARILGKRAVKVDATYFERVARPFTPLLLETQERIAKLQRIKQRRLEIANERNQRIARYLLSIHVYASSRGFTSRTFQSDYERSHAAISDTKMKLWQQLEQDLKLLLV